MGDDVSHQSVLLSQALDALAIKGDGAYIDGTFGRGGHARGLLSCLGEKGRLLGIDKDPDAIVAGQELAALDPRFIIEQGSFSELTDLAQRHGLLGCVDGVLLDLGVSSPQLDEAERGFSFLRDGPLDMRMNPDAGMSAAQWLAVAKEVDISAVLKNYGEERYARRIAKAIVAARMETAIDTTHQLAEIVSRANPAWEKGKHPATRSFQGIRIFINRELDDLKDMLDQLIDVLAPGGRIAIISFHSLEDRIVKRFLREQARGDNFPPGVPVTQDQLNPKLRIERKAIRPSDAEVDQNPRARSAVLRIAEKLA